ncbi:16772_t:CDS:2 [Rhizophagus irregularis]|nr:16772_t:CDS:2 [Rhizophagus irregularis]
MLDYYFNRTNKRRVRRYRQVKEGDEGEICFRGGYGRGRDEGETPINYSSWDRVVLVRDTWNTEEHLKYTWEKPTKDAWDFTLDGSAGEWGETPVAPQSAGGWGELIEEPEAGGWGEEPEALQSAGGWGEEPEAPQSAGGWGETPVTTATGGWDELIEEPEAPQSAGTAGSLDDTQVAPQFVDDVKTSISSDYVSGRSTEKSYADLVK